MPVPETVTASAAPHWRPDQRNTASRPLRASPQPGRAGLAKLVRVLLRGGAQLIPSCSNLPGYMDLRI